MTTAGEFRGFPQQGLDFLADLALNNDRDWFSARKQVFQEAVQKPSQEFVVALGERLRQISPGIGYDTRLVGGSIMRIYRDIRFSKDKTPYHTKVRLVFWEAPSRKEMRSGFHVRIDPGGAGIFAGVWQFERVVLAAYRDAVVDEAMGADLVEAIAAVRDAGGYTVGGEHYKQVPSGYDPEHPRADLLRYNGLYAHTSVDDPGLLTRPHLVDVCFEQCQAMSPIHHWLVSLVKG